jgi:hypothetical protein
MRITAFRMGAACALAALATFAVAACKPPAADSLGAQTPIELPAAEPPATKAPSNVKAGAATDVEADIDATNGVIFAVDRALM